RRGQGDVLRCAGRRGTDRGRQAEILRTVRRLTPLPATGRVRKAYAPSGRNSRTSTCLPAICASLRVQIPPPLTPPHKGEGNLARGSFPSPLWGGVRGGGTCAAARARPKIGQASPRRAPTPIRSPS